MDLDLGGTDKLMQMDVFSDMFHKSPFGAFLCREDGSFVLANRTLSEKLNIPEAAFDHLTIHELVVPQHDAPDDMRVTDEQHREFFANWFKWPTHLEIEARGEPFRIFGYGPPNYKDGNHAMTRIPHPCITVVEPIYLRDVGKMISRTAAENKTVLAYGTVVFVNDFSTFTDAKPRKAAGGCPVDHGG